MHFLFCIFIIEYNKEFLHSHTWMTRVRNNKIDLAERNIPHSSFSYFIASVFSPLAMPDSVHD